MTTVVNRRQRDYDVYIARGSIFGNPYEIGVDGTREEVIARYKRWFEFMLMDKTFRYAVKELRGKRLGCYCHPLPCHGDIIKKYLDSLP